MKNLVLALLFLGLSGLAAGCSQEQNASAASGGEPTAGIAPDNGLEYRNVRVKSTVTDVQPMTGIVFWTDNEAYVDSDAISLEYSYMPYNDIVPSEGVYDWSTVDRLLDRVAARGHQAILRFYYDAFVSVNGVRAEASLKGLLPGNQQEFIIRPGSEAGDDLRLRIECDRLVQGQQIQYDADL